MNVSHGSGGSGWVLVNFHTFRIRSVTIIVQLSVVFSRLWLHILTYCDVFSWSWVKFFESRSRVELGLVRLCLDREVES